MCALFESHQGTLEKVVHELFAGADIITNTQQHARNPISGKAFEIDVWIPSLALGFEFQDLYHFSTAWYYHRPLTIIRDRDSLKRDVLQELERTLVHVPYWWNSGSESLIASIHFLRPDLFADSSGSCPIPLNPPRCSSSLAVPDVGELMLASVFPSVAALDETFHPTQWWMGEKYDGMRCVWNKSSQELCARRGQVLEVPSAYASQLAHCSSFADGELWCGRGSFLDTQLVVRSTNQHRWVFARLVLFDDPLPKFFAVAFEDRYKGIMDATLTTSPFLVVAPRVACVDTYHISQSLNHILQEEGEGIILRKSQSLLEPGRSSSLIKIKTTRSDTEALVVSVSEDSIKLKMPSGMRFQIASSSSSSKLAVGDVVTYEYDNYSQKNIPVNPKICKIRKDLSWDDVLMDFEKDPKSLITSERMIKPAKYWTTIKGKNMRAFLEDFARKRELDPLLPETWYSMPRKAIVDEKEARSFLVSFSGNHVKALMSVFPDLDLQPEKFTTLPSKYWTNLKNRRRFFDQFATRENFDPLVAENWYPIAREDLSSHEGFLALVLHYDRDYISALLHLYPDIGLTRDRFVHWDYWQKQSNRRDFFRRIAEQHSFDPLVPHNWYSFTQRQILAFTDGAAVLHYHRNNFVTALLQLYPKIGLDKNLFHEIYWADENNRKRFFEDIALKNGFDSLLPENWYWLPRTKIFTHKDAKTVLSYHRNDFTLALKQLYPQIGIIRDKFRKTSFFLLRRNRRDFFDSFAKIKEFDPLIAANWRNVSRQSVSEFKGGSTILRYYKNNLQLALKSVYSHLKFKRTIVQAREFYQDQTNRKRFFDAFAKEFAFDPLIPENWYTRTKGDICNFAGGRFVLRHYADLPSALNDVYPSLDWDPTKEKDGVTDRKKTYRSVLDTLARNIGFDPLVASNWLNISQPEIMRFEGALKLMKTYNSFEDALVDLYPEIAAYDQFKQKYQLFQTFSPRFIKFAKEREFEHLDPKNWYTISPQELLHEIEGFSTIYDFFAKDFARALEFIFPNVALDENKLAQHAETPRELFDKFAGKSSFDPLIAENWYKITRSKVLSMKGSETILTSNLNFPQQLAQAYPNIGIDISKFRFIQKQYWKDEPNQRAFFIEFAREKGFNPDIAENWYSVSYWDLIRKKKASSVLVYYNGDHKRALCKLFSDLNLKLANFS